MQALLTRQRVPIWLFRESKSRNVRLRVKSAEFSRGERIAREVFVEGFLGEWNWEENLQFRTLNFSRKTSCQWMAIVCQSFLPIDHTLPRFRGDFVALFGYFPGPLLESQFGQILTGGHWKVRKFDTKPRSPPRRLIRSPNPRATFFFSSK